MTRQKDTRRGFMATVALGAAGLSSHCWADDKTNGADGPIDPEFFVRPEELTLKFLQKPPQPRLAFAHFKGTPQDWRKACRQKLAELLGFSGSGDSMPGPAEPRLLRRTESGRLVVEAWVMPIDQSLSIPAYLLCPTANRPKQQAIMAIHGHGEVEPCLGKWDDYHHAFALRLAQAGHLVLCPELRGFGALADLAQGDPRYCLDYWTSARGRQFTLVTDGFLHGSTLIGQTVEDLLRWEDWLARTQGVESVDVAGISYGGDLALTYPVFSRRARRVYASGSFGSFAPIFARCYNAPAHCIPGVLQWMDRSDIAGMIAPRPIRLHYGEHDTPGPENNSAAYNESVEPALAELRAIYKAFGAEDVVSMIVSRGKWHEFDIPDLQAFLS